MNQKHLKPLTLSTPKQPYKCQKNPKDPVLGEELHLEGAFRGFRAGRKGSGEHRDHATGIFGGGVGGGEGGGA